MPLPIQARRASINHHINWRDSIEPLQAADLDDDLIVCDPYSNDPPSKRSDRELSRTLAILDSLERGMDER
jgi:hypothetical protein